MTLPTPLSLRNHEQPERRRLSSGELDALKAAHPLHEVAARYGLQLARSGPRYVALCPFHAEEHPSFTIFPGSQRWWCFGCRRGGDVIELIRLLDGVGFCGAVARLGGNLPGAATRGAAVHLIDATPVDQAARCLAARASADGSAALEVAVTCYQRELEEAVEAQRYLARRGVSGELARACRLGFASGTRLVAAIRRAGVPLRAAWQVGLLVGHEGVERFAGRITVPEVRNGQVRWLTGRLLDDAVDIPRYMSLPGPRPLLGVERLVGAPVVIGVEGAFDWLTLVGWGMPAFAALGGSPSATVIADLRDARVIYLAFDRDTPGQQAAHALARRLDSRARLVVLPTGVKDVNELGQRPAGRLVFHACVVEAARCVRMQTRAAGPRTPEVEHGTEDAPAMARVAGGTDGADEANEAGWAEMEVA